jgi:CRISPR-associated protein Csm1
MSHYNIFQTMLGEFVDFKTTNSIVSLEQERLEQAVKLVWKDKISLSKWNGQIRPLQSILQKLTNPQIKVLNQAPRFIKPQVLTFNSDDFFNLSKEQPTAIEFKNHYTEFIDALSKSENAEQVYVITQKYGTSVGYTEGVRDVSLFDFVKLVSAAYICLGKSEDVVMIGGDLSGIQDFIYEIVPKTAAKSLKGRSFYIQMLIESAVFKLLKKLELTEINVVYASGGIYYILAPNTEIDNLIFEIGNELINEMFKKHQTLISMQLAYVSIGTDKEVNEWTLLKDKLVQLKNQRFKSKLDIDFNAFFSPKEKGGLSQRDGCRAKRVFRNKA